MDTDNEFRAGRYILQPRGYRAFIPANFPPIPPIAMDDEMWTLLSDADRAIGGLDGSTAVLPNPDLFVYMYVRKEGGGTSCSIKVTTAFGGTQPS